MIVTAHIDISTPKGRKILQELEKHTKQVKIDHPLPSDKTFSLEEVYEEGLNRLSELYGTDMHKLK